MKNQDLILKTSWLRDIDIQIEPKSSILVFPELNVRILFLLLVLDVQPIEAAAYMTWKRHTANNSHKV